LLAVAGPGLAQPGEATEQANGEPGVLFSLGLNVGDAFAYALDTELTVTQMGSENDAEPSALPEQALEYEAEVRFTVIDVGDDGAARLRAAVFAYEAEWEDAAGETEYSHGGLEQLRQQMNENGDGDPDAEGDRDASPLDRAFMALARTTVSVTLDAEGAVTGLTGFERFNELVRGEAAVDDRFIGPFANEPFRELIEPLFTIDGARGARWSVGDGWQTDKSLDFSNVAALDYTYSWQVDEIEDDEVELSGAAQVSVRRPTTPDALRPDLALRAASETVETEYDRERRLVSERDASYQLELVFSWAGDERSMLLEQTTRGSTALELIDPDSLGWSDEERGDDDDEGDGGEDGDT
jgi:hypothetical protein